MTRSRRVVLAWALIPIALLVAVSVATILYVRSFGFELDTATTADVERNRTVLDRVEANTEATEAESAAIELGVTVIERYGRCLVRLLATHPDERVAITPEAMARSCGLPVDAFEPIPP